MRSDIHGNLHNLEENLSRKFMKRELSSLLVYASIIIYILIVSWITILKHYSYKTATWDLGIYEQVLWSTAFGGKFLYYTPDMPVNPGGSFFGIHFSPILFLILPIYALCPRPETLLVLQTVVLALGALPLFWLTKDMLNSNLMGIIFVLAYLLYPPLNSVNLYDFHVQAFIPTFLFFAFYYFKKRKWVGSLIFIVLALMCIEAMPIMTFFLGMYMAVVSILNTKKLEKALLKRRDLQLSVLVIVLSIVWLFLSVTIIGMFNPERSTSAFRPWSRWGSNFIEIGINIVTHPIDVFIFMFTPLEKTKNILYAFGPLALLPFLAPLELLLVLPWFLAALLAEITYPIIGSQYSGFIGAQMFIAALQGIKNLSVLKVKVKELRTQVKVIMVISLCVLISFSLSPLAYTSVSMPTFGAHEELLTQAITFIPSDASVVTQDNLFPHLNHRLNVYAVYIPEGAKTEYIFADIHSPFFSGEIPFFPPFNLRFNEVVQKLMEDGNYGFLVCSDSVILLKKDYVGSPLVYTPYTVVGNYRNLKIFQDNNTKIVEDSSSKSGKVIAYSVQKEFNKNPVMWYGPYESLPPGNYTAIFRLKLISAEENVLFALSINYNLGKSLIKSQNFTMRDFVANGAWQNLTLSFSIKYPVPFVEFKGVHFSGAVALSLDYIYVRQESLVS